MLRTMNNIYLVYEYCNDGNLDELIKKNGFIKE
jgi:serine/threonine protein kinase